MNEKQVCNLAIETLTQSGTKKIPRLTGINHIKEEYYWESTGETLSEYWTVWFELEDLPFGIENTLTVYVHPDGLTEAPDIL
ncbi:hypothetical protein L1286_23615 [Pseudoalteromonas sp. SMS1]|uniref:hypothetical protein n=1 Tax=Pseudoalteromonas sp. SMS1 TaxID=2908894 RepID=UPI001F241FB9|nr:hypothetical protein [Pseudoalteromonas sp. SMS1]MCF2860456.1 hypothetical protein [Pseudoalteromonas sp. SMS1]